MNAATADRLDVDVLVERAEREAGEGGFEFLDGLRVLCESLERDAAIRPEMRTLVETFLVTYLVTQVRVRRHMAEHREIDGLPIKGPVFIIGLLRTGSTFLHNLLAQHPGLRCPNLWELMTPAGPRDPRHQADAANACEAYVQEFYRSAPRVRAIHPFETWRPHECHRLLSTTFQSRVYWMRFRVPGYAEWLEQQDLRAAYAYHRVLLKNILWRLPGDVAVLKCPFHVWSLDALTHVYPTARFIHLHRDPSVTVPSTASLCAELRTGRSDRVDRVEIGRFWLRHVERALAMVADARRTCLAGAPILNVRYPELIRDPMGTVTRVCEFIGVPLTGDATARIREFLTEQPLQRHGEHRYTAEEFGLDRRDLLKRFAEYRHDYEL